MRILYARANLLRHWVDFGRYGEDAGRDTRRHERQPLSLWCLYRDRGCDRRSHGSCIRCGVFAMKRFTYVRAVSIDQAIESLSVHPDAKLLAGGTNLVDLMKYDVATPTTIIDINDLPLREISETADGGLRIGALVTNSDVAVHPSVARHYPLLASAI